MLASTLALGPGLVATVAAELNLRRTSEGALGGHLTKRTVKHVKP